MDSRYFTDVKNDVLAVPAWLYFLTTMLLKPKNFILLATLFWLTFIPLFLNTFVILGEPYLPLDSTYIFLISTSSFWLAIL